MKLQEHLLNRFKVVCDEVASMEVIENEYKNMGAKVPEHTFLGLRFLRSEQKFLEETLELFQDVDSAE